MSLAIFIEDNGSRRKNCRRAVLASHLPLHDLIPYVKCSCSGLHRYLFFSHLRSWSHLRCQLHKMAGGELEAAPKKLRVVAVLWIEVLLMCWRPQELNRQILQENSLQKPRQAWIFRQFKALLTEVSGTPSTSPCSCWDECRGGSCGSVSYWQLEETSNRDSSVACYLTTEKTSPRAVQKTCFFRARLGTRNHPGGLLGSLSQHSLCFSRAVQPCYGAMDCVFLSPEHLVPSRCDQGLAESCRPNCADSFAWR